MGIELGIFCLCVLGGFVIYGVAKGAFVVFGELRDMQRTQAWRESVYLANRR